MGVRPSGTVTFLFTDIVGSTQRWEAVPDVMRAELAAHDEVLRAAVEGEAGWLFKHTGDGVCAAFQSAQAAVDAAIAAQRGLGLPVRMGIASGEAELRGDDYFGSTPNTAARVMAAGHGGQIVVAASTASLTSGVDLADLGVRSLRDLSAPVQLFQVCAEGLLADFPALRTVDVVPGNLPVLESSFVGRDDAVDTVVEAVAQHRVVTLVGVGGVGKTRLALQSSAMLAPRFRGGVWLIELAAVTNGGEVDAAVAAVFALQPRPGGSWREIVVDSLRDREVLLVIDNCEHVLDEVAALVDALGESPSVRVVVTSRESLAVAGEWAFRVPSLAASSSIELFVERADTASSGFRPDDDDLRVIGEICHRLDGIPLAIELAAARVRAMSPAQIRDRLDERFRLLTGSRRSIERHQTLRHAVQWSYDLLEPTEQTVLQQVAVFVGGFMLDAANAITGLDEFEVLDVLDSLVRKSLLHVERSDGDVRYRMLETIRQFAEEALADTGTSDELRARHAAFFADQADVNYELFQTDQERFAHHWVDAEIANLSAAFAWAHDSGHADPAVRIAAKAHAIAREGLRTETFGWPEAAIELARQSGHRQLPLLLTMACNAATGIGRLDDGLRYGLEAIAVNDDARYDVAVTAYYNTAMALYLHGDTAGALSMLRAGAEHPDDHPMRGNLGYLHVIGNIARAAIPEQESNDAIAQLGVSPMPAVRGIGRWVQSELVARSDLPAAIALAQQAIDIAVECGCRTLEESVRGRQLGLIAETEDLAAALDGFACVVDAWQIMGDVYTARGIYELTLWLARLGYHDGAARLYGAVTHGYRTNILRATPEVSALAEALGETAFADAYDAGAALDLRSAGELAHRLLAQVRDEHTGT